MPVRHYGIYLCYPPQVDLRAQGLGRQLAAFLLAAELRTDVSFVIACPSWMRGTLQRLCDDAGVDFQALQILAPAGSPVLLQIHSIVDRIGKRRPGRGWLNHSMAWLRRGIDRVSTWAEARAAGTRSHVLFIAVTLAGAPILTLGRILQLLTGMRGVTSYRGRLLAMARARVGVNLKGIKGEPIVLRLYRHMEAAEVRLLHKLIAARPDIAAWHCPTAFWPHFNDIAAPRVMTVPDVLLAEHPIAFSILGGARFVGVGSVVVSDLLEPGVYAGLPAMPLRRALQE